MPVTTVDWIRAVVQIALLTVFFYNFYITLAQNRATQMIRNLLVYAAIFLICKLTGLSILENLLRIGVIPFVVFLCVLYQADLKRTFTPGFRRNRRKTIPISATRIPT